MRVLYVPDLVEYGGAFNSFCEMVKTLSEKNNVNPIIICSKKGKYEQFARDNNYEVHIAGYKAFFVGRGSSEIRKIIKLLLKIPYILEYKLCEKKAIKKLESEIDFTTIDIIHTNVNRNSIGAEFSKKYKIPHIWHIREFGDKDYNCMSLKRDYIPFMNENTSYFIAISNAIKMAWVDKGIDKDKIRMIYNGVDTNELTIHKKLNKDIIKIIMAGEIIPQKGQMVLVKAIGLLDEEYRKRIKVDFYGNGSVAYIRKIKHLIDKLKLSNRIELKEYTTNLKIILPDYDIGVMGSKSEGFGRVTIEYMLSGLCVIATNSGANPELIEDKETGYLFNTNDYFNLYEILKYLIDNPKMIKKAGLKSKEYAQENFSKEINAQKVYQLYNHVLKINI